MQVVSICDRKSNKKEVINTIKKFFLKLLTLINFNIFLFSTIKNIPVNINKEFRIIDKNLILKPNCIKIEVKKEKKATEIIGY